MQTPEAVAAMLRRHQLGWGIKRIARELDCSPHTVRRHLRRGRWMPCRGTTRRRVLGELDEWLARIQPGGRLGLFGFGASALCAIQVALHWGCDVFVCTRSEREQQTARDLGASWAGGYTDRPPVELDAAITFAPSGDVVIAALRSLARGAAVAINAIHLDRIPQFDYGDLWWERSLRSVANFTREDARDFLALAAEIIGQATLA